MQYKEKKEQQKNQKYPRKQKSEQLFSNNITTELPLLFTPLTACFIPFHSPSLHPSPGGCSVWGSVAMKPLRNQSWCHISQTLVRVLKCLVQKGIKICNELCSCTDSNYCCLFSPGNGTPHVHTSVGFAAWHSEFSPSGDCFIFPLCVY